MDWVSAREWVPPTASWKTGDIRGPQPPASFQSSEVDPGTAAEFCFPLQALIIQELEEALTKWYKANRGRSTQFLLGWNHLRMTGKEWELKVRSSAGGSSISKPTAETQVWFAASFLGSELKHLLYSAGDKPDALPLGPCMTATQAQTIRWQYQRPLSVLGSWELTASYWLSCAFCSKASMLVRHRPPGTCISKNKQAN